MPESKKIEKQIVCYSKIAWTLAITAGLMFIIPVLAHLAGSISYTFTDYATFVGGTAGPLGALAGFLFVYIAFQGQQIHIEKQDKQFEQQSFENTFFNLLNYHREFIRHHKIGGNSTIDSFKDKIEPKLNPAFKNLSIEDGELNITPGQLSPIALSNIFKKYIGKEETRDLYQILDSIYMILYHLQSSTQVNSSPYYQILLSQINKEEKFLCFYYFISYYDDFEPFKKKILYHFFIRLDPSDVNGKDLEWLKMTPYNNKQ